MTNPILVEITRGPEVESRHRGAFVVADADGKVVRSAGAVDVPIFPRSAVKAMQALLLVETGAAEKFGLGNAELAFAQASHSGEPGHVDMAEKLLALAGLSEQHLECGSHWPTRHSATIELARTGKEPSQLHNNCSGKHAGFLCTCVKCGIAPKGYIRHDHEFQAMVRGVMEDVTGHPHTVDCFGSDGCGIPTYPAPLTALACGFARMATGNGLAKERASAATRILNAGMDKPWFVAGTNRCCTDLMEIGAGRLYAKGGAEGVYCGAVPELGLGIALKIDDGSERGAESAMCAVLASIFGNDEDLSAKLGSKAIRVISNRKGSAVGETRPAEILQLSA